MHFAWCIINEVLILYWNFRQWTVWIHRCYVFSDGTGLRQQEFGFTTNINIELYPCIHLNSKQKYFISLEWYNNKQWYCIYRYDTYQWNQSFVLHECWWCQVSTHVIIHLMNGWMETLGSQSRATIGAIVSPWVIRLCNNLGGVVDDEKRIWIYTDGTLKQYVHPQTHTHTDINPP